MDTLRDNQDDLSSIERRLAAWRPKTQEFGAEAMLFAAGFAAGRRGANRFWAALCAVLIVPAASLGVWGMLERADRLSLARALDERVTSPRVTPATAVTETSPPIYMPSPNDYFHQRRRLESDVSSFLASVTPSNPGDHKRDIRQGAILRAGQWNDLLD